MLIAGLKYLNFPVELSVKDDNYDAYFSFDYRDFNADLCDTHGYDLEEINSVLEQAGLEKLERKEYGNNRRTSKN